MARITKRYIITLLILFCLYNIIVFLIPYPHQSQPVFWTVWAMGAILIAVQPLIAYFAFRNSETLISKIYGLPIIRIGYISLIVQMVITALCLILGIFFVIPYWILVIVECVLVGFSTIGILINKTYKEEIEKIEQSAPLTLKFINDLKVDANLLLSYEMPVSVREKVVEFYDEVKYSDPVSNKSLLEIEDEINRVFTCCKEDIINKFYDEALIELEEATKLIKERNIRTKNSKRE